MIVKYKCACGHKWTCYPGPDGVSEKMKLCPSKNFRYGSGVPYGTGRLRFPLLIEKCGKSVTEIYRGPADELFVTAKLVRRAK